MVLASLLAGAAGGCAAAAGVDWLALRAERPARVGPAGRPLTALAVALGRRTRMATPRDLAARLESAGLDGRRAADLMAGKTGAAILAGLLALVLGPLLPGRLGLFALLAGPAAGFLLPDMLVRRRTRRRARVLARELPDVLDLLRVAVEAGLTPGRAMGEVGARAGGPLGAELRDAARRLVLGEPTAAVLDRLALRCPVPAVAALVAAIRRAARHGAPLAPALAALATDARAERARGLREEAAKAAPKIQLVVALALVPGVLLLIAAVMIPRVL